MKAALAHNDCVTAVGRVFHDSLASVQELQPPRPSLAKDKSRGSSRPVLLPLLCDIRIRETVDSVVKASLSHWGKIDVITNCSGYGIIGACEDQDDFEIRDQFETNFWGTLHVLQLSLPYFRERKAGRYIILSSTSGSLGVPGLGPFCATKYAVEGLIESMLYETAEFNIRATLVEPGHIRQDDPIASLQDHTDMGNGASTIAHFYVKPASLPYGHQTSPSGHAERMIQWLGDKQPTSATKAVELVWQLGHCSYPPLRLLLGGFAVESVRDRLRCITEEIEDWKFLSFNQDSEQRENDVGTTAETGDNLETNIDMKDEDIDE